MTKHALNAFLATSVAFINELARLCERSGADAQEVERGLKSDARIGPSAYLSPGRRRSPAARWPATCASCRRSARERARADAAARRRARRATRCTATGCASSVAALLRGVAGTRGRGARA